MTLVINVSKNNNNNMRLLAISYLICKWNPENRERKY